MIIGKKLTIFNMLRTLILRNNSAEKLLKNETKNCPINNQV